MTNSPKHLTMLRSHTAADALTMANASCGTISLFLCLDYVATGSNRYIAIAFLMLPLALVFDVLDGYVARAWLHPGPARRMGHGVPDLFRRVRRQPTGAVQRDRGGAVGRQRQGEILPGHADSNQHRHRG